MARNLPPRDELGRFVAALDDSAEKLQSFSREVEESTRASSDHARAAREAAQASIQRLGDAAMFGASTYEGFASSGDFSSAFTSNVVRAAISSIKDISFEGVPVGQIGAAALGINRAEQVLGTASDRVGSIVADLRRYNIDVPGSFIDDTLSVVVEQEKRAADARRMVDDRLFDNPALLEAAGLSPAGVTVVSQMSNVVSQMSNIAGKIEELIRLLGGGGGAQ